MNTEEMKDKKDIPLPSLFLLQYTIQEGNWGRNRRNRAELTEEGAL